MLFEQYREGNLNPARIINHFADMEEQREVASLFNATIQIETEQEKEKALHETIYRVKQNSIFNQSEIQDFSDIVQMQQIVTSKRQLEELAKLQISLK